MREFVFPDWYEEAERMYVEEKLSYSEIARRLGLGSHKTISLWLRRGGHESNLKYLGGNRTTTRKYFVDEDSFNIIDTADKAYWLGFLYADGCINEDKNEVEVGLAEKDRDTLEQLTEFLKSTYPIKEKKKYDKKYDKTYIGYRINVRNKKMVDDLIKYGCTPRKSLTLVWPNFLPDNLIPHFIRGYFDGDGCIYEHSANQNTISVEILGTIDFLEGLQSSIPNGINSYINPFRHVTDTHRLQMHGPYAYAFMNWIYKDKKYYLKRKYEKFNKIALPYRDRWDGPGKIGRGLTAGTEVTTESKDSAVL